MTTSRSQTLLLTDGIKLAFEMLPVRQSERSLEFHTLPLGRDMGDIKEDAVFHIKRIYFQLYIYLFLLRS